MRTGIAYLGISFAAGALVACTTLLGDDFEVADPGTATGAGTGAGTGTGTGGGGGTATGVGGGGDGGGGLGAAGGGGQPAPGDVLWEASFGDAAEEHAVGIGYLSDGSLALAGWFEGSLDFGGGALVSGAGDDTFAARLGADGNEIWADQWGGADDQRTYGIAVDGDDNLFLFGWFAGGIDFGLGALTPVDEGDLFTAKLTDQGQALWSLRAGGMAVDHARLVTVTPANDAVIMGTFQDDIDIGAVPLTGTTQTPSSYIAKLASVDGQTEFAEAATPAWYPDGVFPNAVTSDTAGNLAFLLRGATQGSGPVSITYDGNTENGTSSQLVVLYRTDTNGGLSWSHSFGSQRSNSVSTFSNGDVLACGRYSGAGDFSAGFTLPTSEGSDVWAAQFSATGTLLWSRRYGGPGADGGSGGTEAGRCVALPDGSFVMAARSDGDFDIGGTVVPGSADSLVVARIDSSGTALWTQRSTGIGDIVGMAVSADEVALLLNHDGAVGFATTFDAVGLDDIYVARLAL